MGNVLDLSDFSSKTPQLVVVHENVDRASIPWWKKRATELGYNLIFQIKHKTDKLDVLAITTDSPQEAALKGLSCYLNWQIHTLKS